MSTILIVDDNKKNLQVLGNILNEQKYKVAMAMDGQTALKLSSKIIPDLIVLDIMMPGMDGFEVCEVLKSQESTKKIPIIFLSAKIDMEDIVRGFQLGGADYITKPFKKEELLARIGMHLELMESRKKIEKQASSLKALNTLKDKIFAVVATDMKGALDRFVEIPKLIADPRLNLSPDELNDIMKELQIKASNTYNLLENVLYWSRSQRNLIEPQFSKVNLSSLFNTLKLRLTDALNQKNIQLLIERNNVDSVISDSVLLELTLKNIIHNAIKFSNLNSSVLCSCSLTNESTVIRIQDWGIGMSTEELNLIKDKYSYLIKHGTNGEKGSGIGLKISAEILSLINVTMQIESTENEGTTISLSFPFELKN